MNKILIILLSSLLANCISNAQEIFSYVEQMPQPKINVNEFISANLHYPADAKEQGMEGKVTVKFIVDSSGNILNPTVPRSVHPSIDSECIRVIAMMPKWEPGKQNGRAVSVYTTIPINFQINDTAVEQSDTTPDSTLVLPQPKFSLRKYLYDTLFYPPELKSRKVGGTINFEFTIDTTGNVVNVTVVKTSDAVINKVIKKVLYEMPKWQPGSINGQPVCIILSQEITYSATRTFDTMSQSVEYRKRWTTPKYVRYEISCH